jgi:hypothetical protein
MKQINLFAEFKRLTYNNDRAFSSFNAHFTECAMTTRLSRLYRVVPMLTTCMVMFLVLSSAAIPAKADFPTDGRINLMPWVNSWGAVAVYCVDQFGGHSSYTGGYIQVLNAQGQRMLKVLEATINQVGVDAQHTRLIQAGDLYTLWRLPSALPYNGDFLLTSKPDAEGKTFIGRWHDCTPITPPSGTCTGSISLASDGTTIWSTSGVMPGSVQLSASVDTSNYSYDFNPPAPFSTSGSTTLETCQVKPPVTVTLYAQCTNGGALIITSNPASVVSGAC